MWQATRDGSQVHVVSSTGQKIARVGDDHDHRIHHNMMQAKLMASAPEMLEVLIDIQELFRREYFVDDHPILESIFQKCNDLIDRSFDRKAHELKILRKNIYTSAGRQDRYDQQFPETPGGRVDSENSENHRDIKSSSVV